MLFETLKKCRIKYFDTFFMLHCCSEDWEYLINNNRLILKVLGEQFKTGLIICRELKKAMRFYKNTSAKEFIELI